MPGLESAAIGIWVGAGGRNETKAQNGIAHFLEHMAFKGTDRRSALQIAEAIEDVGGYINAYTSREVTAYYARVLRADVPLALDVIADILRNPTFEDAEIEVERGVILSEIGQALDTPDDVIFDWLQERAYPDQPLGRTILGPAERIRAFDRKDLASFVAQHYGAGQMILSAAGAIDHDAIVALAETLFGDMPAHVQHDAKAAAFHGGEVRQVKPLEQAHFALAFESPDYRSPDAFAAQIYATALGGGMSSRLFQEVREKRGLVYSVYSFHSSYSDDGQFGIYAGTGPDKLPELIPVVCDEVMKIGSTITEQELDRAKAQLRSSVLMARESMMNRANQHAKGLLLRGKIRSPEEIIKSINAVEISSLEKVAKQVFTSAPTLAALGPLGQLEDFDKIKGRLVA